jgi:DNA-binding SARP family transcriptional activator
MARHRGGSRAWPSTAMSVSPAETARDQLGEAVTELRRLTREQLLPALERLADADGIPSTSGVRVDSARRPQRGSAEHLRVAAELWAAARCSRLIEQQLRQQIDVLMAGSQGRAEAAVGQDAGRKAGKSHRTGPSGWLKAISRHGNSAHQQPHSGAVSAPPVLNGRMTASPAPSPPPVSKSEADVAALMLGPLELNVAGRRVVRWNSQKAKGVFQYLLLHGRPVRRDVLMELQWPNHTHTSARNNLNVALHSLRNTLNEPGQGLQPVLYQDGCYLLNPGVRWWIDRDEFLSALNMAHLSRGSNHPQEAIGHYQRAVGLYRGPLFEDDITGDWYLAEQRHLNELHLQALESLGEMHLDLGELTSAEWFGQQALTSDPCCEPAHRLLMQCYALEHKQQLVSRQYRLCVEALHDELGVAPGTETLRLFRDLTSTSR